MKIQFMILELLEGVIKTKIEIHLRGGMSQEEFFSELFKHRINKILHRAVVYNLHQAYETGKLKLIVIQG